MSVAARIGFHAANYVPRSISGYNESKRRASGRKQGVLDFGILLYVDLRNEPSPKTSRLPGCRLST